jgi:hypothetical protein
VSRTHATTDAPAVLRHACTLCGGCCQGVRVPVYDRDRAAIARAADHLGIPDPIDGAGLRLVDGACVFLGEDDRCRIHATLGAQAKPTPCRQFPLVAVQAEDGVRIGVDPASYGAWRSWREGPALPDAAVVATRTPAPGGQAHIEAHLVARCEHPDTTLESLLGELVSEPPRGASLPPRFAARWAEHLHRSALPGFLVHDTLGRRLRGALAPVLHASVGWEEPPPWPALDPEIRAWTLEAVRRVLYLRLLPGLPNVPTAALLLLGGAVAAAWTDPRPGAYHDHLTAWLRALRFPVFWQALVGDRATLAWLVTGRRPGAP